MPERVRITDVSPRDGLQNEPGVVPATDKARLIGLLSAAGVDEIECASFVAPRWVPQLADAERVVELVLEDEAKRDAGAAGARGPVRSALVPNLAGFERMEALHARLGARVIGKIAVFTAASETFSRRNTNATIAETMARFAEFVPTALAAGYAVRAYISCAVACPFEGPIAPGAVRRVADGLLALGRSVGGESDVELDLGDTIGAATPETTGALLRAFSGRERAALTLHLHDTFGRAGECVRAALAMAVRSFDGSVAGLGGCPYAGTPERRAPGNIATEALVRAATDEGFTTGVDAVALARAGAFAREIVAGARAGAAGKPEGGA